MTRDHAKNTTREVGYERRWRRKIFVVSFLNLRERRRFLSYTCMVMSRHICRETVGMTWSRIAPTARGYYNDS